MIETAAIVCLAMNVYMEARSEPIEGQMAVAQVTVRRAVVAGRFEDDRVAIAQPARHAIERTHQNQRGQGRVKRKEVG